MQVNKNNAAKEMAKIEITIGKIMRIGVLIAAIFMLLGIAILLITSNSGYSNNSFPTSIIAIIKGIASMKAYAFMMAGTFFLILTPVLRVIVSIYAFGKKRHDICLYHLNCLTYLIYQFLNWS